MAALAIGASGAYLAATSMFDDDESKNQGTESRDNIPSDKPLLKHPEKALKTSSDTETGGIEMSEDQSLKLMKDETTPAQSKTQRKKRFFALNSASKGNAKADESTRSKTKRDLGSSRKQKSTQVLSKTSSTPRETTEKKQNPPDEKKKSKQGMTLIAVPTFKKTVSRESSNTKPNAKCKNEDSILKSLSSSFWTNGNEKSTDVKPSEEETILQTMSSQEQKSACKGNSNEASANDDESICSSESKDENDKDPFAFANVTMAALALGASGAYMTAVSMFDNDKSKNQGTENRDNIPSDKPLLKHPEKALKTSSDTETGGIEMSEDQSLKLMKDETTPAQSKTQRKKRFFALNSASKDNVQGDGSTQSKTKESLGSTCTQKDESVCKSESKDEKDENALAFTNATMAALAIGASGAYLAATSMFDDDESKNQGTDSRDDIPSDKPLSKHVDDKAMRTISDTEAGGIEMSEDQSLKLMKKEGTTPAQSKTQRKKRFFAVDSASKNDAKGDGSKQSKTKRGLGSTRIQKSQQESWKKSNSPSFLSSPQESKQKKKLLVGPSLSLRKFRKSSHLRQRSQHDSGNLLQKGSNQAKQEANLVTDFNQEGDKTLTKNLESANAGVDHDHTPIDESKPKDSALFGGVDLSWLSMLENIEDDDFSSTEGSGGESIYTNDFSQHLSRQGSYSSASETTSYSEVIDKSSTFTEGVAGVTIASRLSRFGSSRKSNVDNRSAQSFASENTETNDIGNVESAKTNSRNAEKSVGTKTRGKKSHGRGRIFKLKKALLLSREKRASKHDKHDDKACNKDNNVGQDSDSSFSDDGSASLEIFFWEGQSGNPTAQPHSRVNDGKTHTTLKTADVGRNSAEDGSASGFEMPNMFSMFSASSGSISLDSTSYVDGSQTSYSHADQCSTHSSISSEYTESDWMDYESLAGGSIADNKKSSQKRGKGPTFASVKKILRRRQKNKEKSKKISLNRGTRKEEEEEEEETTDIMGIIGNMTDNLFDKIVPNPSAE